MRFTTFLLSGLFFLNQLCLSQIDIPYQVPDEPIKSLILAPETPYALPSSNGEYIALFERAPMPSIKELAQPEIRIAGLRINPGTNGSSRSSHYLSIQILEITTGKKTIVEDIPENLGIENPAWSPDCKKLSFTLTRDDGISLWIYDISENKANKLAEAMNDAIGYQLPYRWLSDSKQILVKSIPANRGAFPDKPMGVTQPIIQESSGRTAPSRTYQDLLKNKYDEDLFEFLCSSQIKKISLEGAVSYLGSPGIYTQIDPSPDGTFILTQRLVKPFSYLVPYYRFPIQVEIWDIHGKMTNRIADIPLAEEIPIGFNAVREGPRSFTWRSDRAADLYWVEARDGGDPNRPADIRDQLFHMAAPFDTPKSESVTLSLRYNGIIWGSHKMAIITETWWKTRRQITSSFMPDNPNGLRQAIFDRSYEDRYNDPGKFQTSMNQYGEKVLLFSRDSSSLYLFGDGASPQGDMPFIDQFEFGSGKSKRLWQSEAPYYEIPIQLVDIRKNLVLTRRESKELPPNYILRNIKNNKIQELTDFQNPYTALFRVSKEVIKYKRKDGLDLKGDLYLPAGYTSGDRPLPVLMWAYPDEFKSKEAAGQVSGSPYEFIRLSWRSPLFWVTRGYAIFDDISMPVVGEGDEEPNDTFIEQLVMNAEAAISILDRMGVGDPARVAIGGHSYGAFMTANLMAHSDLFAAGIARSGAYNRTLTPFGFQSEERTFWEAPSIYYTMSPFMHADKIKEPVLLIHGEADNNSGTFPIQSERLYNAIKGHGGTARLVMLPYESHGYRAEESILHMLWEMDTWLDKYVKNK